MIELSITVRNSESSLTDKHLVYDAGLTLTHDDARLTQLVEQAIAKFSPTKSDQEDPFDVIVKAKFIWQ